MAYQNYRKVISPGVFTSLVEKVSVPAVHERSFIGIQLLLTCDLKYIKEFISYKPFSFYLLHDIDSEIL